MPSEVTIKRIETFTVKVAPEGMGEAAEAAEEKLVSDDGLMPDNVEYEVVEVIGL